MIRKASVDAKAFSTALDQVSKILRKSSIPVLSEVTNYKKSRGN